MTAFVCARCARTFESPTDAPRCPTCLRKSSVRPADDSEIARLARGEATSGSGARAALLLATVALAAPGLGVISLAWRRLAAYDLALPAVVAELVALAVWLRAALVPADPERPLAAFLPRAAIGAALGGWALVSGAITAQAGSLSPAFTVVLGVLIFAAGVVGALHWLRGRDEPTSRGPGKWR
ncbi:MAG: hypothetical protein U0234_21210 [Sandaracinus sp.]